MTIDSTTIGEAARDRFAEWAPQGSVPKKGCARFPAVTVLRTKTSGRLQNVLGQRIRVSCGSVPQRQHAKAGKTFPVIIVVRASLVSACWQPEIPHPHLLGLRFFAWFPKWETGEGKTARGKNREWRYRRAAQKG
jgi:hypothetical protein